MNEHYEWAYRNDIVLKELSFEDSVRLSEPISHAHRAVY